MADFDDADPAVEDEFENDEEEMDDANEPDADADADADADDDQGGDEDDEDDDVDNDDNDDDDDEDGDDNDAPDPSPSRRQAPTPAVRHHNDRLAENSSLIRTSLSPLPAAGGATSPSTSTRSAAGTAASTTTRHFLPSVRPEALTAQDYDIVPTIAAPQGTSINALAATPDMRWVFTGGTDGYVRMYNWADTVNGKVPLTVAQKHPFVDSVMKAGSLHTYWENEEAGTALRTPSRRDGGEDAGKWISPVYSLAVQQQAVWLLSGLESGGINLQTCRHEAGTLITTLREHSSAVSVLTLARDEQSVLSGSWDKNVLDWDLHTGQVKRRFRGSGGQICAVEFRPASDLPVPELAGLEDVLSEGWVGTMASNNAGRSAVNGAFEANGIGRGRATSVSALGGDEDAMGSPNESLFGENDHGSLFGEDNVAGGVGGAGVGGNAFADEDDEELSRAIASGLQETDQDAPGEQDTEMGASDGPQPRATTCITPTHRHQSPALLTAPHTNDPATTTSTTTDLYPQSESTFLSAAIDGSLRLWDRRRERPITAIPPPPGTPPWCTGACWSPDGNTFYVGRRNNIVEEYSIHHFTSNGATPVRQLKLPPGSGPVYAVRAMPNSRHLVCASQDILRVYDLRQHGSGRGSVPFTIVPGHRGGVISAIWLDPTCRFMLSAAGNRGWEGGGTEVLLGYEIGVLDEKGVWHR
ncbi:hypothetical protein M433DRAFT_64471 [Acidomyces richmondensis BFW]|nr:MAG: hypothetical protein FE78DRAFT_144637 [Acidomyces sp. 'richmondensis']KYG46771.1 hypothetical protein M433DRAFT_64471 [Acidomyces richmondensis BFW]